MNRVAIVSHDAGGAEILSSWLLRSVDLCSVVLDGPAVGIFNRKCFDVERLTLTEAIEKCDWVLCGTGWSSDLERQAIKLGKQQGKKTVAFLDHWVNYRERFEETDGSVTYPDEIWVGDKQAQQIAKEAFPTIPIKLHINPYFDDLDNELKKIKTNKSTTNKVSILYVCEPIRKSVYTEEDALKYFLENIEFLHSDVLNVTIRPHPSESFDKYQWTKNCAPVPINVGGVKSLLHETVDADVVVGCETMAMVVALHVGKRVISCIPPRGGICKLPHSGIEHLQNLVEKRI
jgi:hypothetical protein